MSNNRLLSIYFILKQDFVFSALLLLEQTLLKRFGFYYQNSYLSEVLLDVRTSTKFLGPFLRDIGSRRDVMTAYMKGFLVGSEFAAIDLTAYSRLIKDISNITRKKERKSR